jgi:endonuclease V-like protein UPF0215 family
MPPRAGTRPHLLGVDDGAFDKWTQADVPIVAVMMEGGDLVEAVAITRFAVDGDDATGFLAQWVGRARFRPALQGVVLGGITIAGLGVVDVAKLAKRLVLPVLVVNRRDPADHRLHAALAAAGLEERCAIVDRAPGAFRLDEGVFVSCAGIDEAGARSLLRASLAKSNVPEPLRLAHLIGRAVATGESRGRP